jgi:hypothetical protein
MKTIRNNFHLPTLILFIFPLFMYAQTPGTFPGGPGSGRGNAPSTSGLHQIYTATGHYTLSADGKGTLESSMTIRVNKPNAAATVAKALLLCTVTNATIGNGCCSLAGTSVNWDGSVTFFSNFFSNYWADVTSIVAPVVNPYPAGLSTLDLTECNTNVQDGEALLVIFNDASAPERTIIIMWGGEDPSGDNFALTLASPLDPSAPGTLLDMGLGIGFSYQSNATQQYSLINVNNQRLTTSAGGEDDGGGSDGMLITVGGIGDSDANPPDPNAAPSNPRSDDELYSLLPYMTNTTTAINVFTQNPSNDDNIFLSYFVISGAAILGEGILLSQTTSSGPIGGNHTVKALLLDGSGQPIAGRQVSFAILSGPNSGITGSGNTDGSGQAFFTYTDNGSLGTDQIQACFINDQSQTQCSNILTFDWVIPEGGAVPTFSQWGLILLAFVLLVLSSIYIAGKKGIA